MWKNSLFALAVGPAIFFSYLPESVVISFNPLIQSFTDFWSWHKLGSLVKPIKINSSPYYILLKPVQCNTNIFDYSNIRILGGEYLVFEYEYLFSSVQIYLIFIFGQIDLTNIYSVHFGIVLLDIRHIFGIYSNIRHRISII